MNILMPIIKLA